jgi:hypothetical protein
MAEAVGMDQRKMKQTQSRVRHGLKALTTASVLVVLAGCVDPPPPRAAYAPPPPPPPVSTEVFAYPLQGQTPDQQGRDRYECSLWATQQTGFDPSAPNVPPSMRVRVVQEGPPPGTGAAVGAIAGAIIGAAAGGPRSGPGPALFGAIAGAAIGSTADAEREQASTREVVVPDRQARMAMQAQAVGYRRAVSACMQGRGYSVR